MFWNSWLWQTDHYDQTSWQYTQQNLGGNQLVVCFFLVAKLINQCDSLFSLVLVYDDAPYQPLVSSILKAKSKLK